jgi:hypothetical protein
MKKKEKKININKLSYINIDRFKGKLRHLR